MRQAALHSPFLYGLVKPGIYLPEDIVLICRFSPALFTSCCMSSLHYKRRRLWWFGIPRGRWRYLFDSV